MRFARIPALLLDLQKKEALRIMRERDRTLDCAGIDSLHNHASGKHLQWHATPESLRDIKFIRKNPDSPIKSR